MSLDCPVISNAVFLKLSQETIQNLRNKEFEFAVFNEHTGLCRFMTTWNKDHKSIDNLVREILRTEKL